jgi:hypothetical protein
MRPDSIDVVIRQTASEFGGDIVELIAFRALPSGDDDFEPGGVSDALRGFVFRNGGTRFTLEERRHWTDAGASASGVVYVLELLGSGAVGVAMSEIYRFAKDRLQGSADDAWQQEAWAALTVEEMREQMLSDAERFLEVPRGTIKAVDINRTNESTVMTCRDTRTGTRYHVESGTDGAFALRMLDGPS